MDLERILIVSIVLVLSQLFFASSMVHTRRFQFCRFRALRYNMGVRTVPEDVFVHTQRTWATMWCAVAHLQLLEVVYSALKFLFMAPLEIE